MLSRSMPAILLSALLALAALSPQEPAPFRSLFDGQSLAGWVGEERFWRVEDGAIVGESTAQNPCERTTWLILAGAEFGDFDLRCQVRIEAGNSGVQFRSRRGAGFDVLGLQADLTGGPEWTGCLYEQGGRGVVARRGEQVELGAGERSVERVAPDGAVLAGWRRGDWNELRIVAMGERVVYELNGLRSSALVDRDPEHFAPRGLIALQLHAGPPMRVAFRDLLIRELAPGERLELAPIPAAPAGLEREPHWIWRADDPTAEQAWLARRFVVDEPFERALLVGTCDDEVQVRLNGAVVAEADDWRSLFEVDVTAELRAGPNTLLAAAGNAGGPAGLLLTLDLERGGARVARLVTDGSWSARADLPQDLVAPDLAGPGWAPALSLGELGVAPWGRPAGRGDGRPPGPLEAGELELPVGYRAELVHAVSRATEGSWVALTFDERGRALCADQYGLLYRVELPPWGSGAPARVERLDVQLSGVHGLCSAFGALYAVRAEDPRTAGLYRARDTDGDDRYDELVLLRRFHGAGEHGPHAVVPGPDGSSLYVIAGNHTRLPEPLDASRVPRVWADDQVLPLIEDPNGHAVGIPAPGGWIARTDPDGERFELVAVGLRNAYDLAFGPTGELFTFDSDMEWDVGLPWYRATRVLHVVSGADFGWRRGSGKWPDHYADSLPPVVEAGLGSPTGVLFAQGEGFAPEHRGALLLADWAYGRVLAVQLEPSGAGYTGRVEPFLAGAPFPVCDLALGPDGALYLVTGGRRTRSGLYRVRWEGAGSSPRPRDAVAPRPGRDPAADGGRALAAAGARVLRRQLEAFHGRTSPLAVDHALAHLDAPERGLRYAARIALEHQPLEDWVERALAEERPRAAADAAIALARHAPRERADELRAFLGRRPLTALDDATLLTALRAWGLVLARLGPPTGGAREQLVGELRSVLGRGVGAAALQGALEAARLLAALGDPELVERAAPLLEQGSLAQRLHLAYTLSVQRRGWSVEAVASLVGLLESAAAAEGGGASYRGYLTAVRERARASIGPELFEQGLALFERSLALLSERSLPEEGRDEGAEVVLGPRPPRARSWELAELLPVLDQVGGGRSFARGRAAYEAARCLECHSLAGRGGASGPDLGGAAGRFSARDLLEEILAPSREVPDRFRDTIAVTLDGVVVVGRLEHQDERVVRLRVFSPREDWVELERGRIETLAESPLSPMPLGLLDTLDEAEILDLLAYVLSGADPAAPAFAPRPAAPDGDPRAR